VGLVCDGGGIGGDGAGVCGAGAGIALVGGAFISGVEIVSGGVSGGICICIATVDIALVGVAFTCVLLVDFVKIFLNGIWVGISLIGRAVVGDDRSSSV